MMIWRIIIILFKVFALIVANQRIECRWGEEYLCGDKCLRYDGTCFCGNKTISYYESYNYYCCTHENCIFNFEANVECHGRPTLWNEVCGENCMPNAQKGWTMLKCQNENTCYLSVLSCNGMSRCKDKSDISNCSNEVNCTENGKFENCGQMEDALYQNYGCKNPFQSLSGEFFCANRMDKSDILFDKPPVRFLHNDHYIHDFNVNQFLNFDEENIYCGKRNISYEAFKDVMEMYRYEECDLKDNNMHMTIDYIWKGLLTDFSFKMSSKLDELYRLEREVQLRAKCLHGGSVECAKDSEFCSYNSEVCDGTANCPDGEDELFDNCKTYFPPLATIECLKKDAYNINITIKAFKCDGIVACEFGEDEAHCSLPDYYLLIALPIVAIFNSVIALIMWRSTIKYLPPINQKQELSEEELETKHDTISLKTIMNEAQGSTERKILNNRFLQMEMKKHDGQCSETICCTKNSLDPRTVANIMHDCTSTSEKSSWSKSLNILNHFHMEKITFIIKMVTASTSHIIDLMKDFFILFQVVLSQGGLELLMAQPEPYIKGIYLIMLGSIIVPLLLSTMRLLSKGPEVLFGGTKKLHWMATIILMPILPTILIMRETTLSHASHTFKVSTTILANVKYHVSQFIQADLGLESHLQVIISIILLLLSESKTPTVIGLKVLFERETMLYLPTSTAITFSIIWSLVSCIRSHMKGILKKREYLPTLSYVIMLVFATSSIALRIFSCTLFFTPGLGLFSILRHLQGEMYPFYAPLYEGLDVSTEMFYFGDAPEIPWSKITRWNYTSVDIANPPNQTIYTFFSIGEYFWILMGVLIMNIIFQIIGKRYNNPDVYKRLSLLDVIIHGMSCCFIPHAMEEWDEQDGCVTLHKTRKNLVKIEMMTSIVINFSFNIFLLTPLIILGVNIFERHDILVNSIGALPEENYAFRQIIVMIAVGYSLLVLLTIIQTLSYFLYNDKFHPFALIIHPDPKFLDSKATKLDKELVDSLQSNGKISKRERGNSLARINLARNLFEIGIKGLHETTVSN